MAARGRLEAFKAATGLSELTQEYAVGIAAFTMLWVFVQASFPIVGQRFESYRKASRRTKRDWAIHAVALIHALWAGPVSLYLLFADRPGLNALRENPILGFDPQVARLVLPTVAFFVHDLAISTIYNYGIGFVIHGAVCLFVFTNSFRPACQGFGGIFLAWELSTVPLNIHWFLDKTGQTGSTLQLINGIVLIATFFSVRLGGGIYWATPYLYDHIFRPHVRKALPRYMPEATMAGLMALNVLNIYWLSKMIKAVTKRFTSNAPKPKRS